MAKNPDPEPEPAKATEVKAMPDSEQALAEAKEIPPAVEVKPMPLDDPNAPRAATEVKPLPG